MRFLAPILNIFRFHKLKILFLLVAFAICLIALFPLDDASDFISTQVTKATQNQVFLQFEHMSFQFIPSPGIQMSHVLVATQGLNELQVGELSIAPFLPAFLSFQPGIKIKAEQIFRGAISLIARLDGKNKQGSARQKISMEASNIELADLLSFVGLAVQPKGQLEANLTGRLDSAGQEPGEGQVQITIEKFHLPNTSVPTPIGQLPLPELKLGKIELQGVWKNNKLQIQQATFGEGTDELKVQASGEMDLRIQQTGGQIQPIFGVYSLELRLSVKKSFLDKAGLFLSFLDAYKKASAVGADTQYALKISGNNFYMPPNMTPL